MEEEEKIATFCLLGLDWELGRMGGGNWSCGRRWKKRCVFRLHLLLTPPSRCKEGKYYSFSTQPTTDRVTALFFWRE